MFELSMKKVGAAMLVANVGSFKQLAKLSTIQALAKALHVDPAELLEEV